MNFIRVPVVQQDSAIGVRLSSLAGSFVLPMDHLAEKLKPWMGKELILGIRPEQITDTLVSAHANGFAHRRAIPIEMVEPTGPDTLVFIQLNGTRVVSRVRPEQAPAPGSTVELVFDVSKVVFFDPETEKRAA